MVSVSPSEFAQCRWAMAVPLWGCIVHACTGSCWGVSGSAVWLRLCGGGLTADLCS